MVVPNNHWVFLLKMNILGCFGDTTIFGNTHISIYICIYSIHLDLTKERILFQPSFFRGSIKSNLVGGLVYPI